MKKINKRLTISKKIVANLNAVHLAQILGGVNPAGDTATLPTNLGCPDPAATTDCTKEC